MVGERYGFADQSGTREPSGVQFEDHSELIRQIAHDNHVPASLIEAILNLEPSYRNLHAWGARPALRRALAELVEAAMPPDETTA